MSLYWIRGAKKDHTRGKNPPYVHTRKSYDRKINLKTQI